MRALIASLLLLAACEAAPALPAPAPRPSQAVTTPRDDPPASEPEAPQTRAVVVLAPLGPFDPPLLDAIATGLEAELQVEVRRLDPVPLPASAWYPPRRRYRAERILEFLPTLIPDAPSSTRILGLTQKDISTTKAQFEDWGVFGLGDMPGQAAVVSSFRLARKAKDAAQVQHRVVTTAVHEVGHTLGLDHCTEHAAKCPMQDAQGGIANTDASTGHLGPQCRAELDREMPRQRPRSR